ncbi:MAG: transcription antitermination factor NusB [Candidatus Alcyoniella australis]|nr:transcription antitermination factor NusB [Candidatus Alcyoniella australis]
MGNRHRARECALQLLYQLDYNNSDSEEQIELFWRSHSVPTELMTFASSVVRGVVQRRSELDLLIAGTSENWTLERMSTVDRNILRLAVFELLHVPDVPRNVTLNEAVELGKKFGTEDSGAFVNGILDRIAKEHVRPDKGNR